jgi:Ser/Thr protein kinase RdoA (MazF antagonist)
MNILKRNEEQFIVLGKNIGKLVQEVETILQRPLASCRIEKRSIYLDLDPDNVRLDPDRVREIGAVTSTNDSE